MNDYFLYDDRQLIALLREKHPVCNEAFNVLYYRYSERLKSYCIFKTDNREDAKDLHQETWLKFHSAVLTGKNDINLPAYIYSIARNLSIDRYRVNNNHKAFYHENFDMEQISDSFNLQSNIENRELLKIISLALDRMSDIYKETFILKWFSGLKYAEISVILDESVNCIKQRSSRAFDELLKILKPIISDINNQR